MPGNLRDIKELEAEVEARPKRGITKQDLLDLLQSQAKVAGTLLINGGAAPDQQLTIAAGWNRIDVWERSIDTQGVRDGLTDETDPGGWFRISNAAAGDYSMTGRLRAVVSDAGDYEIRAAHFDGVDVQNTPFHDKVTAVADEEITLAFDTGIEKDVARDERLQMEIRGPNGATVTILYGQFAVWR